MHGSVGGKIASTRKEVFAKYSDANTANIDRYLAYMFCFIIFDPKNKQDPRDKIKAIQEFGRRQQQQSQLQSPSEPSSQHPPQSTGPTLPPTTDSLPSPSLGYISSLEAQVTSLRFFEGTDKPSTRKQRKYSQQFSKNIRNSYSSNINWELCLKYPPKRSPKDFGIGWKVLDDDSKHIYASRLGTKLQQNTSNSCHTGLIFQMLEPGFYRFDIYVEDEMVASNSFEVY